MKACPNCGAPLGAGPLDGLCPRCLVAGTAESTEPAAAALQAQGAGVAVIAGTPDRGRGPLPSDAPSFGLPPGQTSPCEGSAPEVGLVDPDAVARAAREAARPGRDVTAWTGQPVAPLPRIEGYDILRELSHGGQGVVYLAVQRSTKRKVAIKVLLSGRYASRSARHRFEREIELVASLKHPNIIAVFDSGTTAEGYEYYVMDYVRGVPATAYVREKKPTLEEALALFATVCEAVNHAHQRGVIHRDLKPSNVLVDVDGNLRVLDFGLAKAMTDPVESQASVTGNVVGTLPYMSPEQTRGNPDEIDTRTDVYALGVMLYEMLTGRHPYPTTGGMAEVVRNITEAAPGRPSRCWSSDGGISGRSRRRGLRRRESRCPLDFEIETIVLKALAKDREQRYDSAGQFARDIRRYLAGEQIVARRSSAWYQLRVFARRNKIFVAAAAAVFIVLTAAVSIVSWQWQRAEQESANAARAVEALGNFAAAGGDALAEQGDFVNAHEVYSRGVEQTAQQRHPGTAILMGLLEIRSRDAGRMPLLGSYGRGGAGGFRGHTAHPNNVAVLTKTKTALTAGTDGRLILWDLVTGLPLYNPGPRAAEPRPPGHPPRQLSLSYVAVSPNEQSAAVAATDGRVDLFSLGPSSFQETGIALRQPGHEVWMVALADDLRVLTGTGAGKMTLWDGRTGEPLMEYEESKDKDKSVAGLAFHPKHRECALSGCGDGTVRLWHLKQAKSIQIDSREHVPGLQVNCVGFSPDGKMAFSAGFDRRIILWDVTGEGAAMRLVPKRTLERHVRMIWRAAFSPAGDRIASASEDGTVRIWDVATGHELHVLRGQTGGVHGVEFLNYQVVSTGDTLFEGGQQVTSALKLWDLRDGAAAATAVSGAVTGIDVNDDGRVTIRTDAGSRALHIGWDGGLPRPRYDHGSGHVPRPAAPDVRADDATAHLGRWRSQQRRRRRVARFPAESRIHRPAHPVARQAENCGVPRWQDTVIGSGPCRAGRRKRRIRRAPVVRGAQGSGRNSRHFAERPVRRLRRQAGTCQGVGPDATGAVPRAREGNVNGVRRAGEPPAPSRRAGNASAVVRLPRP